MVKIIINNHNSKVIASARTIFDLKNLMKIKAKNYFWSPAFRRRQWDGYVNYITDAGRFDTGLLKEVCDWLREMEKQFKIVDRRERFRDLHEVTDLGELVLRKDQKHALHLLLNNQCEGIRFVRGIMAEATNYGKSILIAGVFAAFSNKRKGIVLTNSKTLFTQTLGDLQKLLGKDQVGWMNSNSTKWLRVNVCMVQTLGNRVKKDIRLRNLMAQQDIVLIDEYDLLIGRKDCKFTLAQCYNATIRVGFTGSELLSKDKNRNQEQIKFTGPVIHKVGNLELVEKGISTPPKIKFFMGNDRVRRPGDWQGEYEYGVVKNRRRNDKIWRLVNRYMEKGPIIILFKLHEHGERIMKACPKAISEIVSVRMIHHKSSDREKVLEGFKKGKVDVLVASMIIRRGMNLPTIRTLINAAGGDSEANVKQIFGRVLRKHKSKKVVDIIEFWDWGAYLQRHSKHRIRYYKTQGFPVQELYKPKLKKLTKRHY